MQISNSALKSLISTRTFPICLRSSRLRRTEEMWVIANLQNKSFDSFCEAGRMPNQTLQAAIERNMMFFHSLFVLRPVGDRINKKKKRKMPSWNAVYYYWKINKRREVFFCFSFANARKINFSQNRTLFFVVFSISRTFKQLFRLELVWICCAGGK